jgi:hypothetical protein
MREQILRGVAEDYIVVKEWADEVAALEAALKDAEAEIAKLNYIDLPNEKVSNVFEAYLAWKSKAQASEKQVAELREDA